MANPAVGPIAQAVAEIAKVIGQWMASADRRKLEAAKEAAEQYIFVNEKEGQYKDLSIEKQKNLLKHFRKRFFSVN